MAYNYNEFIENNKVNKMSKGICKVKIDHVSFPRGLCRLSNGAIEDIAELVSNVFWGKICISNPSKLANWSGFKEVKKFCVCEHCLMAIECHEGSQATKEINFFDEEDWEACDMCEELCETLYEIL